MLLDSKTFDTKIKKILHKVFSVLYRKHALSINCFDIKHNSKQLKTNVKI